MARLNLDHYAHTEDASYSDGSIELELLSFVKAGEYDWYQDGRWEIVYHLSPLRQNILNWFPFTKDCSILEIGAGPGALTGLLCQHARKVVAVDLTRIRCEINYERNKHFDNLEIIVGDINRIRFEQKFDYVIINGVLEYASYMIDDSDPYREFLMMAASHLNQDGRILLSIENRLGLKYFSGAKEDHTGKCFSGVNGYHDGEKVRTFSKYELQDLVSKAGLTALKFYYPYPDYKFSEEILTDESINQMETKSRLQPFDMVRVNLFNEDSVRRTLMQEKVLSVFSNSFLVEIAWSPEAVPASISYVKVSANRKREFQIMTLIDMTARSVIKRPLFPEGSSHLKNFLSHSGKTFNQITNLACEPCEDGIRYQLIDRESMESLLLKSFMIQELTAFVREIERFRKILYSSTSIVQAPDEPGFARAFGDRKCTQPLRWTTDINIDLIMGNIFPIENRYEVIDYEWHMPCSVPVEFALWRMIAQFVQDHPLQQQMTKKDILSFIEIEADTENVFQEWEHHFSEQYVGMKNLSTLGKDVVTIDLDQVMNEQLKNNRITSTLFLDQGEGYSDLSSVQTRVSQEGAFFRVRFESPLFRRAKAIRWDPLEGQACRIGVVSVDTDGESAELIPLNADSMLSKNQYEFSTFDPQFRILGNLAMASYIEIVFTCMVIDWTSGYFKLEQKNISLRSTLSEQEEILSEHQQLIDKVDALEQIIILKDVQFSDLLNERKSLESELTQITETAMNHRLRSSWGILTSGKIFRQKKGVSDIG